MIYDPSFFPTETKTISWRPSKCYPRILTRCVLLLNRLDHHHGFCHRTETHRQGTFVLMTGATVLPSCTINAGKYRRHCQFKAWPPNAGRVPFAHSLSARQADVSLTIFGLDRDFQCHQTLVATVPRKSLTGVDFREDTSSREDRDVSGVSRDVNIFYADPGRGQY